MITAWRLAKARYQNDAFSGDGGLHSAGRWHLKLQRVAHAGIRWVMFEIGIPDSAAVEVLAATRLAQRTARRIHHADRHQMATRRSRPGPALAVGDHSR